MNSHYTYLLIHLGSLVGPLLLSFDKKVAFYRKWKPLFKAMIIPAIIFLIWDAWFTHQAVWSFSDEHTIGWRIIGLPIEEILFFFTVPYCCVFIYECIRVYFPSLRNGRAARLFMILLAIVLLVVALLHIDRAYTAYTFIGLAVFILAVLFIPYFNIFDPLSFVVSYLIILIPFLIVNGFLTSVPVVLYNNQENLGIRIFSFLPSPMNNIPLEDIFYGMLLILMNVAFYEKARR
jgi:lycopene cyclase domain-containing protein